MKNLLVAALALIMASSTSAAEKENTVKNGGFEQDTDGDGMADYWQFAGDKGVTVTWGRDEGFAGQFSQKLTCTHFTALSSASHAMLCQINTVQLEKGKWYKISFAAKQEGIRSRAVQAAISNTKPWRNCGLEESFRVPHAWKRFEFVFQATETISEHTRLQFWHTSTGSFWLDDVRLEPSEAVVKRFTEVLPPSTAVNLLPNSSFECGTSGWGSIADLPGWGGNLNLLVGTVDTTAGKFHRSSFKIALTPKTIPVFYFDYFPLYRMPVKAPLLANRGWITVSPGVDYTLSAYMKANSDGLVGAFSIEQAFRGRLGQHMQLTTKWERHSFTFQPRSEQVFIALGLDLEASKQEAGTVWIDGVQLEKGPEATPYCPRTKVEAGLETDRPGNLFPYGAEPKITAKVFNADDASHSVTLRSHTTNFDDAIVNKATTVVDIPPGRMVRVPISPGVQQKGFYRLDLHAEGAEVVPILPMRFAIIEPYTKSNSLFGMNHAYPWSHLLDSSKQIGLCWFRDWSLKWHDIEQQKGKFEFTQSDYQINRVLERGLNVLPLLPFPSTNWSSSAGPEVKVTEDYPGSRERIAYMPRDLGEFAGYVRTTVQHYRKRLHVWEILNEPIYTSYALPSDKGCKVEDYVQLLQAAYQAVKEADPNAFVIGGIAGGATTYTKEFIDAGGLRWVDILNLHTYPGLTAPDEYEEPLRQLRERMRTAGADKPIWFTEGAYYADDDKPFEPYSDWLKPVDSETESAEWQVKLNTLLLAYGAEKIIYHSGTPGSLNNASLSGIFFEWAGEPRKMLVTQSAMANLLLASVCSLGRIKSPEMLKAYGFETDGRTVIVAWAEEGAKPREISLAGKPWRAVDLQGNELKVNRVTLTERPVYFVAKGTALKEFPW
ncbi:MAG: carbohydrate binding domain-containing protein [Planctomycetota bacterium]|nr:carbohydrate binding domain-containing protein [Planctomycetota bacterium]